MNINQMIGDYLKKEDFPQPRTCTISHVSMVEMDDTQKPVLHLQETTKGLVLNKTNINLIVSLYGPETDHWSGKPLTLYNDPNVTYAGKATGGVRVMINAPAAAVTAPPQPTPAPVSVEPAPAAPAASEDDVPW